MKKMVWLALVSTLLLAGCGNKGKEGVRSQAELNMAAEEQRNLQIKNDQKEGKELEQKQKEDEEAEKEKKEIEKQNFKRWGGSYISQKALDVANRDGWTVTSTDASKLAGMYHGQTRDLRNESTVQGYDADMLPEEFRKYKNYILSIEDSGLYTIFEYSLMDVKKNEGELRGSEVVYTTSNGEIKTDYRELKDEEQSKLIYFKDNKEMQMIEGKVIKNNSIRVQSGYIDKEYGKNKLMSYDMTNMIVSLDIDGNYFLNDAVNLKEGQPDLPGGNYYYGNAKTHKIDIQTENLTKEGDNLIFNVDRTLSSEPEFTDYEFEPFSEKDLKEFLGIEKNSLPSSSQIMMTLNNDFNERKAKEKEDRMYFEDPNEMVQTSGIPIVEADSNGKDYVGYTKDNEEITPDIAFTTSYGDVFGYFDHYRMKLEDGKYY
ncbi:lipoprotein [Carnobacterium sp. TMP28]|uniref:lipoprotein n=1 Tax=Carnobacterium sp. TMP28 TaxID=3397060 RepID=UPI0039E0457B